MTVGWIQDPSFPSSAYLAASAAVVTLASVWLSRQWKRALWAAVVLLMLLRVLSSVAGALDVVLAVAVGVVVGSLALVVFGAPNRAPDTLELVQALQGVVPGLRTVRQRSTPTETLSYRVTDGDGREMFVKLRTPDDRSADYLARLYRAVRLRGYEVEPPYATVQRRIEHEALALLRADDAGVSTPKLVGLVATNDTSAMLITDYVPGERLNEIEPARIDRALLDRLWLEVAALDRGRIAHRNLALENVVVDTDNQPHLVDFDDAELAATRATARPRRRPAPRGDLAARRRGSRGGGGGRRPRGRPGRGGPPAPAAARVAAADASAPGRRRGGARRAARGGAATNGNARGARWSDSNASARAHCCRSSR